MSKTSYGGIGARGTSYSGGSGGGAASGYYNPAIGENASVNGGAGGKGAEASGNTACGGAGNPGGVAVGDGKVAGSTGKNGTGGLLVIYCTQAEGNGTLTAVGQVGGSGSTGSSSETQGGSSGGGSINIFVRGEVGSNISWTSNVAGGGAVGRRWKRWKWNSKCWIHC